jgi:2-methylcitrate dehydratase PrpD
MQQNRGTSCKSFHAGKAASNGLLSAVLAAQGFTASTESLEGKKGFIRIYSVSQEPGRLTAGLRERWEILSNGYKPYACGVVLHPAIDAMLELASQISAESNYWRQVDRVSLRVNPAAIRITGVQQPANGLMSKFSISHAAAVSFVDGSGGLAQFSDTSICRGEIVEFSIRITVLSDDSLDRDQAAAECWLGDGRSIKSHIVHARGTVKNPLDDRQLFNKFFENIGAKKNEKYAEAHIDQLMKAEAIDDISPLFVWPT